MYFLFSRFFCAKQRKDQQHGRPRGSHKAGDDRSQSQQAGVRQRSTRQRPSHVNVAADDVQRGQQNNELGVLPHFFENHVAAAAERKKINQNRHGKQRNDNSFIG